MIMAASTSMGCRIHFKTNYYYHKTNAPTSLRIINPILATQQHKNEPEEYHESSNSNSNSNQKGGRREIILRSSEVAVVGAIFHFSGKKPDYLGVQKYPPGLALCPATKNCVSTSENVTDLSHYAPPWNYNPEEGRGGKHPITQQQAMEELLQVIKSTKPDKYTPKVIERREDYIRVEYESPILGLVDDVEFWFPPGNKSIVQYRSASRIGNFDFDINRKRIKALREALEKKGWASQNSL